jgi:hypothetical protein
MNSGRFGPCFANICNEPSGSAQSCPCRNAVAGNGSAAAVLIRLLCRIDLMVQRNDAVDLAMAGLRSMWSAASSSFELTLSVVLRA